MLKLWLNTAYNLAKVQWPLTLNFDLSPLLLCRNMCLFISILPTKLHYHCCCFPSWRYGWKLEYLATIWCPLTFHLNCSIRIFVYSCQSFSPISLPLNIPSRSYSWKMSFLAKVQWPLTFTKFFQNLISSSTPHAVSLGQVVWTKSIQGFSFVPTRSKVYWRMDGQLENIMPPAPFGTEA